MQEYDILKAPLPEAQRAEQAEMRKFAEQSAARYKDAVDQINRATDSDLVKAKINQLEKAIR